MQTRCLFVCRCVRSASAARLFPGPLQSAVRLPLVSQSHYFSPQTSLYDARLLQSSPLQIKARGRALQFLTGGGVFSKGALDEGSRLLIEALTMEPNAVFCDLGCGWGAVGAFIGHQFPNAQIYACDINARAVQLARFNSRKQVAKCRRVVRRWTKRRAERFFHLHRVQPADSRRKRGD